MFLQIAFQGHYFYGQDVSVSVGTYNMLLDYFTEWLLGSAQYFQCWSIQWTVKAQHQKKKSKQQRSYRCFVAEWRKQSNIKD